MKIEKKYLVLAVILIISLIIIFALVQVKMSKKIKPIENYFSPEPEDWVENDRNSVEDGDQFINYRKATKGLSLIDINRQEYFYYGRKEAFFSHGYYQGEWFTVRYYDPAVSNAAEDEPLEDYTLMEISPKMNPNDGVIEGFILAKVVGTEFVFYIFLDQDWKDSLEFTNIMYGNDMQDVSTVTARPFDFSNEQNGIYIDSVEDATWFKNDGLGGIFVGEIDKQSLNYRYEKDLKATFIYVQ